MTNEEHLEEILHHAHQLGIVKELERRIPANVKYTDLSTIYLREMLKIVKEKNLIYSLD
jgi:hypothetical protein